VVSLAKVPKAKFVELSIRLNRYNSINELRSIMRELQLVDLEDLLELALIENKLEFVYLILEVGINVKHFLTQERLKNLYWLSVFIKIYLNYFVLLLNKIYRKRPF
jgi:hypothetical protein